MIPADVMLQIKPGAKIRVYERVRELVTEDEKGKKKKEAEIKERISPFEGIVLARKHGSQIGATITVRATVAGVGVEKVYPLHSPMIQKVEIINSPRKVHRSKLYYLRNISAKETRQKLGTAN